MQELTAARCIGWKGRGDKKKGRKDGVEDQVSGGRLERPRRTRPSLRLSGQALSHTKAQSHEDGNP
jgi:hypothetical protein